jgi:hypothetical protein
MLAFFLAVWYHIGEKRKGEKLWITGTSNVPQNVKTASFMTTMRSWTPTTAQTTLTRMILPVLLRGKRVNAPTSASMTNTDLPAAKTDGQDKRKKIEQARLFTLSFSILFPRALLTRGFSGYLIRFSVMAKPSRIKAGFLYRPANRPVVLSPAILRSKWRTCFSQAAT